MKPLAADGRPSLIGLELPGLEACLASSASPSADGHCGRASCFIGFTIAVRPRSRR